MARVSRKLGRAPSAPKAAGVYNTAIYVRLSVEDNGKVESESLENQRELLEQYVKATPDLKLVIFMRITVLPVRTLPDLLSSECWKMYKKGKSPVS